MPEKFLFHGRFNIICQFERENYPLQRKTVGDEQTFLFLCMCMLALYCVSIEYRHLIGQVNS